MISYVILDDRFNKIIDSKTNEDTINKVIDDNAMVKTQEFKNYFNNKMVYWYENPKNKYMLIYEKEGEI